MLLMGDEICRTQQGNNNAYCQDNEKVWMDWNQVNTFDDVLGFTKSLIKIRKSLKYFNQNSDDIYKVTWHGVYYNKPDWSYYSRSIAWHITGQDESLYIIANSYHEALTFELPTTELGWLRIIDTNLIAPQDAQIVGDCIADNHYRVESFSICVFIEK